MFSLASLRLECTDPDFLCLFFFFLQHRKFKQASNITISYYSLFFQSHAISSLEKINNYLLECLHNCSQLTTDLCNFICHISALEPNKQPIPVYADFSRVMILNLDLITVCKCFSQCKSRVENVN